MNTKHHMIWLPLIVIITVLASLLVPSPVRAAGEPPPPPGEKSPKNPAAPDKPTPPETDTSYAAEIPVTAPAGAPDGAANAAAVALSVDAIAQAGAVLVGPSGNPLPMAAKDTANVLMASNVYFKGSGPIYECIGGFCYYDDLVTALASFFSRNGSGTIYATGTLIEPTAVNVNGQGGSLSKLTGLAWNGMTNYTPRLNGALNISYMLKGFTVDGFYAKKGITAFNSAGTLRFQNLNVTNPAGPGIFVTAHKGNIDLFNVNAFGTSEYGAYLDNRAGTGNVSVGNSTFKNTGNDGILVQTYGSVLLDRVDASNNATGGGASLSMLKGVTVKDSRFNSNHISGLSIYGKGAISLQNVEARLNPLMGVNLSSISDITVNGGFFFNNLNIGLNVGDSAGNITVNNVTAQANGTGANLDNRLSTTPKTVTVNNSQFLSNTGLGVLVLSKGNVTLNHIRAEDNDSSGIYVDNAAFDAVDLVYRGSGSVSLLNTSGANELINNQGSAISITSKGAITIKGVNALNNRTGFTLDNCALDPDPLHPVHYCLGKGNLSITATSVMNTSVNYGLNARAGGAITLDGDTFYNNQGGVTLDNARVSSAKTITVANSTFTNTQALAANPLVVISRGNISLNNVQALGNLSTQDTVLVDNCFLDGGTVCKGSGSVSVLNSLLANNPALSLHIHSLGAVTLTGVFDEYNRSGAEVTNFFGTGAVTISKSSFSHSTNGVGLVVNAAGKVSLTSVSASFNSGASGGGVSLWNFGSSSTASSTITVSKGVFDNNRNYGLSATSYGNLTANNISASFNIGPTAFGAMLESDKGNVALQDSLGANQFSFNNQNGLTVISGVNNSSGTWGGTISLSGVTAHDNATGYGILVDNQYATTPKAVTIQKVRADNNTSDGLAVVSKGSVTLNNVQANHNVNGWGVKIDNCLSPGGGLACAGNGNVSILSTLGPNSTSYNATGTRIETFGSVVVNGLTASNNTTNYLNYSGLWINNQFPIAVSKPVTVTQSSFNANQGGGLTISATGVITLNGVSANYNTTANGYGVSADNHGQTGSPGVNLLATLGNNQFNYNAGMGLYIYSFGKLALNKVAAGSNGFSTNQDGAYLRTSGTSAISITCSAFNNNRWYGLNVNMGGGVLSFKGVSASGNQLGLGDDFNLVSNPAGVEPVVSWTVCGK